MNLSSRAVALLAAAFFITACSTNSKKRIALTAGSFAAGAALGAASAPKDERQDLHAVYWGAILGMGAAILGNSLFNDEDRIELLEKENQKIKAEMDLIQTGNKVLIDQGKGKFKNPVGETEFQGKKAHWKVYQLDRWTKEGPGRLYHQDKMIEINPVEADQK